MVDSNYNHDEQVEALQNDFLAYAGTGDKHEVVDVDTSFLSGDDYNAVVKMIVVMGAGTTADMMFCGEETYKNTSSRKLFELEGNPGDDYSKYEEYMTDDGRLDLEKCQTGRSQYGLLQPGLCMW